MKNPDQTSTRNLIPETQLASENSRRAMLLREGRGSGGILFLDILLLLEPILKKEVAIEIGGAGSYFVQ